MQDILDKDKLVVLLKESFPTSTNCRLGRFIYQINVLIELLDNDKLVVSKKASFPVVNDFSVGRYKQ